MFFFFQLYLNYYSTVRLTSIHRCFDAILTICNEIISEKCKCDYFNDSWSVHYNGNNLFGKRLDCSLLYLNDLCTPFEISVSVGRETSQHDLLKCIAVKMKTLSPLYANLKTRLLLCVQ